VDADGERLAEGLNEAEALGLSELEGDILTLTLELGERDALGLVEAEGDRDALEDTDAEGDCEADADAEGDNDELGEIETEAEGLSDALGDLEALGLVDGLAADTAPGAVPYQSTPGRGPGWPSSYKNILSARRNASLGNRDWSIRDITPRFQLLSVR
jgi:hypothetical protein